MTAPAPAARQREEFLRAVAEGLCKSPQKELPPRFFYDDVGSALFEAITRLPEYGLTRADERLLRNNAAAIAARLPRRVAVAELGSGSGAKTRWLIEALAERGAVRYFPIDVSGAALAQCRRELEGIRGAVVNPLEMPFLDGLQKAAAARESGERMMVLLLGSTIGNFDRHAADRFLIEVRVALEPGDALLLGTDLVKPAERLLAAYDDPLGVTAAFNLNLLARINRELDGDFVLAGFKHQVRWDSRRKRIEMYLRSLRRQKVSVHAAGLTVTLKRGEAILTEYCHKYSLDRIPFMAQRAGFKCAAQWVDEEWPFAESLFEAAESSA